MVDFNKFVKSYKTYTDFATALSLTDNKTKGDISEEYWRRWFHFVPYVFGFIKIHNANDRSSAYLCHKWPELLTLNVGKPNSALVDLVVEYDNHYDLVSCKWWDDGLDLKEIGTFFTVTDQHLPNLKNKYLTTTAPRTSKIAKDLGKAGKNVIIIYEQEFLLEDDSPFWDQIKNWKDGDTPIFDKWNWRNKREQESYVKMLRSLKRYKRSKFQGPPAWGKTHLMFKLDKYFWGRYKGITINMADGVTTLKQNFLHFNNQYRAYGIYRPSLVICSGADDESLVDWPVDVVGRDPVKILQWIQNNPNGMIFCFYGNTIALEDATKAHLANNPNFEFTFVSCDEASRTCQQEGSGWSHIVHQHRIPVKYRTFLDATPRVGKKIGMDNKSLYGEFGDYVTQPESEKWGSNTGYYLKGLVIQKSRVKHWFHERRMVKGKKYTVEDYCMAVSLLTEKIEDPNDEHTISFGLTINRLNALKSACDDARADLIKKYPKNKKIQDLTNIEFFVADTHMHTTSDIHNKLGFIYKNKKRSIVFTSRLLYRGWSNVQLDSVHFADNFKGTSYLIQALGRGLRKNLDKKNKICKIVVPVDLESSGPWNHLLGLIDNLRQWDYRPMEAIISLATKPRSKSKRIPVSGGVILSTNGVKLSISEIRKSLKNVLITKYNNWIEWKEWHQLAKDYLAKLETFSYLHRNEGNRSMSYAKQKVFDEIISNDRYKNLIESDSKNDIHQYTDIASWLYRKIVMDGWKEIKTLTDWILFRASLDNKRNENDNNIDVLTKQWFDSIQSIRRIYAIAAQKSVGHKFNEYRNTLFSAVPEELKKYYPLRSRRSWENSARDLAYTVSNESPYNLISHMKEEISITETIIIKEKTKLTEEITEWCIDYMLKNNLPIDKIRRAAINKFKSDGLSDRRWLDWIFNQKYQNKFTFEWLKLKDSFISPKKSIIDNNRPICLSCKSSGSERRKNAHGYYYMEYCWTCAKKHKTNKKIGNNMSSGPRPIVTPAGSFRSIKDAGIYYSKQGIPNAYRKVRLWLETKSTEFYYE
jgi:hypothetical protein